LLSDRAQVLLQSGLRVFNEESNQQFLERAYRIVTNQNIEGDLEKTNIHACMGHVLAVRKLLLSIIGVTFEPTISGNSKTGEQILS
jgi:hypothetical protein